VSPVSPGFPRRELFDEIAGLGITLIGCHLQPSRGLFMVTGNALAMVVHHAKVGLGIDKTLLGGFFIPFCSNRQVLLHPRAFVIHDTHIELCLDIAKFGQWQPFLVGIIEITLQVGLVAATQDSPCWQSGHQERRNL